MADNLRITTPVTPRENVERPLAPKAAPASDVADPARVSSRDHTSAEGQSSEKSAMDFNWSSQSVFQKFFNRLTATPLLTDTLQKLLLGAVDAGKDAAPVQKLLQTLLAGGQINREEMLQNLLFQQEHSTKFSGEFFTVLRNLVRQQPSDEFSRTVAQFLKAYDAFSGRGESMISVRKQLDGILTFLPRSYRAGIQAKLDAFLPGTADAAIQENLTQIKEQILPLLGHYITKTNDFGEVRARITLLVHDLSRLNQSSRAEVEKNFEALMDRCRYELNLPPDKIRTLEQQFREIIASPKAPENEFLDALAHLLRPSAREGLPDMSQTMLRDTMTALLNDQSVFMPYFHLILPIPYQKAYAFAEIWVEKDEEGTASPEENPVQLFLAFDVRDLGSFHASIRLLGRQVSLQLQYPASLDRRGAEIRAELTRIIEAAGLVAKGVEVSAEPLEIREKMLRKLQEKRRSVDVTV